jgi:hypothetical protein
VLEQRRRGLEIYALVLSEVRRGDSTRRSAWTMGKQLKPILSGSRQRRAPHLQACGTVLTV